MVKRFLYNNWDLLIICILILLVLKPLFVPGFFSMHDDEQIGRLYELHQNVLVGHIPPRISQNLGFGYGYPLFNFYPPFIYYVGELFVLMGFSLIVSTKIMIGLGFIGAALSMYYFSRIYFGRLGGLISAISYTFVPYHAIDVYVRGALSEFWAFVFIPLIFLWYAKLQNTQKNRYAILAGMCTAGLVLTHSLTALISVPFILSYLIYLYIRSAQKIKYVQRVVMSGIIGLGLSAYFFLPSLFEKQYTMVDLLTKEFADYKLHFVCIKQLLNSTWGYGGSLLGCNDGLSFEIGKVQLWGSILVAGLVAFYFKRVKQRSIIAFFFALLLFSIFLQIKQSAFIWNVITPLWYVQFPWRFMVFTAFFSSFLLGSIPLFIYNSKLKYFFSALMLLLIVLVNMKYFTPYQFLTQVNDKTYINKLKWETSVMSFEYVPKGIVTKKSPIGNTVIDITKDQIAYGSYSTLGNKYKVAVLEDKPHYKKFNVILQKPSVFQINLFSFPGWTVYVDKKNKRIDDNNRLKLIRVTVPPGEHIIEARLEDTVIRKLGNTITLITIILLLIYGTGKLYSKVKKKYGT